MKENKLVNWQNNMKISSAHFTQTENHFIEESINSRHVFLQKDEYGLLPAINEKYELDLEIRTTVSGQVEIALRNCFAITKSGELISYQSNDQPLYYVLKSEQAKNKFEKQTESYNIILSVNPYTRVVTGDIDTTEDPPRQLY